MHTLNTVSEGQFAWGTCATDGTGLASALTLAESLRAFGGSYRESPFTVHVPHELDLARAEITDRIDSLRLDLAPCDAPGSVLKFPYARKVLAAAAAEAKAAGQAAILVWMDEDTVVLNEPREFRLAAGVSLGYRPVMHNLIGSLYHEPPNEFWAYLYDRMAIAEESLFPMITPADRQTIRAYFNAGLLVVRPERGILRAWADQFRVLCGDSRLIAWAREDRLKNIFLHQIALVGAVLKRLQRDEMIELSARYNYPLFFKEMFGALENFASLADVVTLRYDVFFQNPSADWHRKLSGPADRIAWLREHLGT